MFLFVILAFISTLFSARSYHSHFWLQLQAAEPTKFAALQSGIYIEKLKAPSLAPYILLPLPIHFQHLYIPLSNLSFMSFNSELKGICPYRTFKFRLPHLPIFFRHYSTGRWVCKKSFKYREVELMTSRQTRSKTYLFIERTIISLLI